MWPDRVILAIWGVWLVSWVAAAAWSRRVAKRAGLKAEILYRLPIAFAAAVLILGRHGFLTRPIYPWPSDATAWCLAGLVAAGFLFAWWARIHLGALWSSGVTRKDDHRIVDTGPYGIVRHPIYTGIIFSLLAATAAFPMVRQFIAAPLIISGIVIKARIEERFLRNELGREAYDGYARRVPMLVPFWKRYSPTSP